MDHHLHLLVVVRQGDRTMALILKSGGDFKSSGVAAGLQSSSSIWSSLFSTNCHFKKKARVGLLRCRVQPPFGCSADKCKALSELSE